LREWLGPAAEVCRLSRCVGEPLSLSAKVVSTKFPQTLLKHCPAPGGRSRYCSDNDRYRRASSDQCDCLRLVSRLWGNTPFLECVLLIIPIWAYGSARDVIPALPPRTGSVHRHSNCRALVIIQFIRRPLTLASSRVGFTGILRALCGSVDRRQWKVIHKTTLTRVAGWGCGNCTPTFQSHEETTEDSVW